MSTEAYLTRASFVRRVAGLGGGLLLGGGSVAPACGALERLGAADGAVAGPKIHEFVTRPDLVPPYVTVVHDNGHASGGLLFLAPSSGPGRRGNLIVDNAGQPVWFHPTTPVTAMNFRTAIYRGKPVLTWWEGSTEQGLGKGTHVILDDSYQLVARVQAGAGRPSDLHEFLLTPHGTALVTAWELVDADLTSVGGPSDGQVVGGIVQELELPSGRVLFEWKSLDHVPIQESHAGVGAPFDYFHVNSIELDSDGNLLVSARNTWAIYKIDRGSGEVIWRLGGKKSDFAMGPGTGFAWQHDARHHGTGDRLVSLFDDGSAPQVQPQSKGMVIALDTKNMRATLHRKYTHHPSVLAHALGSTQVLPNGNVLVGFGTAPYFTEYSADGKVLFDAKLPPGGQNYRALRLPWTGKPALQPEIAARRHTSGHTVFASWNGATEVASWLFETGPTAAKLHHAATKPRKTFETSLIVPPSARHAKVTALDRHGKPLRTSKTLAL
ncbi:MAG TPA: arylsulfotransferase family protein [Gaiellaceae bacterium]|nr:arylsulfotransferase family protein [Gaiellaceae bacterium]